MSDTVLQARGLEVRFPLFARTVHAVRGVDLEIGRGEILGLVGESGSGKSVMASACLGLVPAPGEIHGSVRLAGTETVGASDRALAGLRGGQAAMIFQNPTTALNPFFTIGRQLGDVIRQHRGLGHTAARAAAVEALTSVRLPDPEIQIGKYPHQLSGGQLQRVMIAMALACRPALLIADEPTTALDVTVQAQIILLLRDLARDTGLSVLFITHDLGTVATICDRVAVMYAGRVVESGPVETVIGSAAHPYSAALLESVPRLGLGRRALGAIPGSVPDMAAPPAGCAFHPRCSRADAGCTTDDPALSAIDDRHTVACHYPLIGAAGATAEATTETTTPGTGEHA